MDEFASIPGLGRQRAGNILVDRPHDTVPDLEALADFATVRAPEGAD
jgi:hypothetical protein